MRQNDSLKSYIGYFQSQLAKIPNCGEDVSVLHSSAGYKSLTPIQTSPKHNITRMSEVLSRAQPYSQSEEAMKTFTNHSAKRGDDRGKSKYAHEVSVHAQDQYRGQSRTRDKRSRSSHEVLSEPTSR